MPQMEINWPTILTMGHPVTIGIDVGATKVVAATVDADGKIIDRGVWQQRPDFNSESLVKNLAKIVQSLRTRRPDVSAVGIGTAGIVLWPDGEIVFAANHGHCRLKLRKKLEALCGVPVFVENDANAAAWAEAITSRYTDSSLLFLAVGTGLGSGFVIDGQVMRGPSGRGTELGHIVVDRSSGIRCSCGLVGCVEVLASGRALQEVGRKLVRRCPTSPLAQRLQHIDDLDVKTMINAAMAGDPDVIVAVRNMGNLLGKVIADNVMSLLPVDRVVLGGGLSVLDRLLLDPMRSSCYRLLTRSKYQHTPRFSKTILADDATMIGAALLAGQEFLAPVRPEADLQVESYSNTRTRHQ